MKFDVLNRFSGDVQFTAEIDCPEDAPKSIKLGLSAKWAFANKADLSSANLRYADLSYADLSYAELRYADLSYADLSYADLSYANLSYADLSYANLSYAHFNFSVGNISEFIKFIAIDTYQVNYTSEKIFIGCETHSIDEWSEFDDEKILEMDNQIGLDFWHKYKDFIFKAIDLAPANPTK